eukprot:8688514-Pyramimonas_sp.AAC.1
MRVSASLGSHSCDLGALAVGDQQRGVGAVLLGHGGESLHLLTVQGLGGASVALAGARLATTAPSASSSSWIHKLHLGEGLPAVHAPLVVIQ